MALGYCLAVTSCPANLPIVKKELTIDHGGKQASVIALAHTSEVLVSLDRIQVPVDRPVTSEDQADVPIDVVMITCQWR